MQDDENDSSEQEEPERDLQQFIYNYTVQVL